MIKSFFVGLWNSIRSFFSEPLIPFQDKVLVFGMLLLVVSPVDFLPDFVPVLGWFDDLILLLTINHYVFQILDPSLSRKIFCFSDSAFDRASSASMHLARILPEGIKRWVWAYSRVIKYPPAQNSDRLDRI